MNADEPHWVLAFFAPDHARPDVILLGSMACFVAWTTDISLHYLDHVEAERLKAEANGEEVSS